MATPCVGARVLADNEFILINLPRPLHCRPSMRVTIREIAARANVDVSTVSRVLGGKARAFRIAHATADRVHAAAQALGYRANEAARALRTGRSFTVGLLVGDLANPFYAALAGAAEAQLSAAGYSLVVATSGENVARQEQYLATFLARQVDGVLLAPAPGSARGPALGALRGAGLPVVLLDRLLPGVELPAVIADNRRAVADVVNALAARGAKRLAFVSGPLEAWTMAERLDGFRAACKRRRLRWDDDRLVVGPPTEATGRRAATLLLASAARPDAIVAANNRLALGVAEVLVGCRGSRPALGAFDGVPLADALGLSLVVAVQPVDDMGHKAAQLLIDRMGQASKPASRPLVLPMAIERHGR